MDINRFFKLGMDRDIGKLVDMPDGIILNLGAGSKQILGAKSLDWPDYDFEKDNLPYKDETVAGIHCYHILEHLKNPMFLLSEINRVLISSGVVNIVVPYYNAQCNVQDLDHKTSFCEETWKNTFKNNYYKKFIIHWKLKVNFNLIIGLVERNLCLMTQLIKE